MPTCVLLGAPGPVPEAPFSEGSSREVWGEEEPLCGPRKHPQDQHGAVPPALTAGILPMSCPQVCPPHQAVVRRSRAAPRGLGLITALRGVCASISCDSVFLPLHKLSTPRNGVGSNGSSSILLRLYLLINDQELD